MSAKNQDKFNFFVPLEIVKGKQSDGSGHEMVIKGIASSESQDSDGETLIPAGYDLTQLLNSGFLNYNHQSIKDPEAIIGEPTKAEITPDGKSLYIEGFLYPDSVAARKVYALAKVLEKNSPNRRLGFSIEGKALERDPFNKKRVLRARITGVAITANPKNPNTLLSIVKGEYAEPFVSLEEEEEEELDKSMTAAAAEGVTQVEHVEGGEKKIKEALNENNNTLTKGQVYSAILSRYGDLIGNNANQAKDIYSFVEHVNSLTMNQNTNNVVADSLSKAFDLLDQALVKGDTNTLANDEPTPSDAVDNPDGLTKEETAAAAAVSSDTPSEGSDKAPEEGKGTEEGNKAPVSAPTEPTEVKKSEENDLLKGKEVAETTKFITIQAVVDACVDKGVITAIQGAAIAEEWGDLEQNGALSPDGLAPDTMEVHNVAKSEEVDLLKGEINQLGTQQRNIVEILENRLTSLGPLIKSIQDELSAVKADNANLIKSYTDELSGARTRESQLHTALTEIKTAFEGFRNEPQPFKTITSPSQVVNRFPNDINKSEDANTMRELAINNPADRKTIENMLVAELDIIKSTSGTSDIGLSDAIFELTVAGGLESDSLTRVNNTLQPRGVRVV